MPEPKSLKKPIVELHYCMGCRWMLRAAWMAQELLSSFESELGSVGLHPSIEGGTYQVRVDGELVWCRVRDGGFPEAKTLKRRVRDQIAPDRDLGHSDSK